MAKEPVKTKTKASVSGKDLIKDLAEMRDKLWTLTSDLASGKVKNVREIKMIKKNIARALTAMHTDKK
mgnify:CR=1 FL=1